MRCSGAVLLRAERNGATLLHLQEHSAARRTGLVHCAGPQGSGPARSRGASARDWPRLQASLRPKVSLFPERSVVDPSLLALSAARCCCCCSSGSGEVLLLPTAFTARIAEGIITGSSAGANKVNARGT